MDFQGKKFILLACSAFILVSCGPKKQEEAPPPAIQQEMPQQEMPAPIPNNEASVGQPEMLKKLQPPQQKSNQEKLTPHQKEELEINEDNVMNPFPG